MKPRGPGARHGHHLGPASRRRSHRWSSSSTRTGARTSSRSKIPSSSSIATINCNINQREVGTDTGFVRAGAAPRAPPGSGHHHDRRNSRPRDARDRAEGRRYGAPRLLDRLHTTDATQTINRVMSFYPPHEQADVRFTLSSALAGDRVPSALRPAPTAGAVSPRAKCSSTPRPCATTFATSIKHSHSQPHSRRHGAIRHAVVRPVAHEWYSEGRDFVRERPSSTRRSPSESSR